MVVVIWAKLSRQMDVVGLPRRTDVDEVLEMILERYVTIGNGSVRFESVQTEPFKNFETWTEPSQTTKLLKPLRKFF